MHRVRVETQCSADYFYSKAKPAETEQIFQPRERAYCRFVDQIRAGKEPSRHDFGDFFLCMFDLHLRNAIHKNKTGQEGIDAYEMRISMFLSQMLVGNPTSLSAQTIKSHIQSQWRMEIIPAPPDYQFITSDNPSVFITCKPPPPNGKGALQLIFLPIDPTNIAVAFDRRFLWLKKKTATAKDVQTFNVGQIQNAEKCIYAAEAIDENDQISFRSVFARKNPLDCEVTAKGWKLMIAYLPPEHHFSFMRLKPPLF